MDCDDGREYKMDASGAERAVLHREGGKIRVPGAGRPFLHLEPLKAIARGAGATLLHLAKMPLPEYATSGSYYNTTLFFVRSFF